MSEQNVETAANAEVVEKDQVPQWLLDDMRETRSLTRQAEDDERSLVDKLAQTTVEAEQIMTRRAQLFSSLRLAAIHSTNPQDWVLNRDKNSGEVIAMPKSSACQKIAEMYGINITNIRPLDDRGVFSPDTEKRDDGSTLYRAWCSAHSRATGRSIPLIEAARSSKEKFTGREEWVDLDGERTIIKNLDDMRNAVLTLLTSKAARAISGLSQVPVKLLDDAWSGISWKSSDKCVKGHGFGSASDRGAKSVADDDTKAEARKLGEEIMRRVEGDKEAAADLLEELTSFTTAEGTKVKGVRSIDRLTRMARVKICWRNLRQHSVYGDKAQ